MNRWEDWAGTERSRPHLRSQERFKRALRGNTAAQIRSLAGGEWTWHPGFRLLQQLTRRTVTPS